MLPGNDKRVVKATQAALEEMGVEFLLGDAVEHDFVDRIQHRFEHDLRFIPLRDFSHQQQHARIVQRERATGDAGGFLGFDQSLVQLAGGSLRQD